jgi:hypothetical protein
MTRGEGDDKSGGDSAHGLCPSRAEQKDKAVAELQLATMAIASAAAVSSGTVGKAARNEGGGDGGAGSDTS